MIKRQPVGIWFNVLVAVLTIASVIVYSVNISSDGYFKDASVSNLVVYCVVVILMLAIVIALAQLKLAGTSAMAV